MLQYTYVPVLSGGHPLPEVIVEDTIEKIAHTKAWDTLTPEQKDNLEYLDLVDIKEIPPNVPDDPSKV